MAVAHNRSGFTLISVMVAVVMLAVGVLSLARTLTIAQQANTLAGNRTAALDIARQRMEFLRSQDPSTLSTFAEPGGTQVTLDGHVSGEGRFRRIVQMSGVRSGLTQVIVRVEYPRMTMPVELITYFYTGA